MFILLLIQDEHNNGKGEFQPFHEHIPLHTITHSYRKKLIFKLESFIKRIRWKTFSFDKNSESNEQLNVSFGFKSAKTPQKNEHLSAFYINLQDMVHQLIGYDTKY